MSEPNIDDVEGHGGRRPDDAADNLEADDVEGHGGRRPDDAADNLEADDDAEGHSRMH